MLNFKLKNLAWILLACTQALSAQARSKTPKSLLEIVDSNLKYIESEQAQQTGPIYWAGEWPTHIQSTLIPAAVGVGKPFGHDDEATAFTTGSVVNALASMYLDHPEMKSSEEFQKIPELIQKAIPTFERYRETDLFNFYPPRMWKGVRVHQPVDMTLINAWKGFTNIPQDADTSSVVYSALLFNSKINGGNFEVPASAIASFDRFRDIDRKGHYYNRGEKRTNTGGFMTWQFDEKSPFMPHFWFASPNKGTRIPFNRNDVDCVVNLNVLRMLALNQSQNVEGRAQACSLINDMIKKEEQATCGIYYPNTYNLPYSAAQAEKAGETCLEPDRRAQLVKFILDNQRWDDGGWINDGNVWEDRIQSTVFAMSALFEFGDLKDPLVETSLRGGTRFLVRQMKKSKNGFYYWKGETFFTATAIARSLVIWKSNSYTTALAANVLLNMSRTYSNIEL